MTLENTHLDWDRSVCASMTDAVIATDKKGLIVTLNPAAKRLLGVRPGVACNLPARDVLTLLASDTRKDVRVLAPRSFQRNRDPRVLNRMILINRTGKETLVDGVIAPVTGERGTIIGSVLVFRDIGKKLIEEQNVLDRQKIEAVGKIAVSIAHDYSNRLAVISGHASSIVDNLIPGTRAHEDALAILAAVKGADALTKRLMGVAEATNLEGQMDLERVDLGEAVGNVASLLAGTIEDRSIVLNIRGQDRMPDVMAEPGRLLDCLVHLVQNAIDAMPSGGTINIDAALKSDEAGDFVVLRVRDTGCGMSREVLAQVFEPFYSTKDADWAVGLGLTVVRSSLQKWGGDVKVRSQSGHGTSFRLFIPRAEARPPRDRAGAASRGETVLLADDKEEIIAELGSVLRAAGHKVLCAKSGEECITVYRKHAFEIGLLVIDVIMPGKDCKSVLEEILAIDPTASIIMISGFSRDYVRGYLERGAWGFVQKPVDRELFLTTVSRMLVRKSPPERETGDGGTP